MRLNSLITFFCPFLHANSNSLSTRNSYHRPTRIFSRVNQDCVDRDTGTALLHCPVWWSLISSLDLHWCHNPVHLWPQDFYTQDISGVWALVLKTTRHSQTRRSASAGFGCTLQSCVTDKMNAVLFTFLPSQGGIRDTKVKTHLLHMHSKNNTALSLIGSHTAFHWSSFVGSLWSTLLCSSPW